MPVRDTSRQCSTRPWQTGTSASPAHSLLFWDRVSAGETVFQKLLKDSGQLQGGYVDLTLESGTVSGAGKVCHLLLRTFQGGACGESTERTPSENVRRSRFRDKVLLLTLSPMRTGTVFLLLTEGSLVPSTAPKIKPMLNK